MVQDVCILAGGEVNRPEEEVAYPAGNRKLG